MVVVDPEHTLHDKILTQLASIRMSSNGNPPRPPPAQTRWNRIISSTNSSLELVQQESHRQSLSIVTNIGNNPRKISAIPVSVSEDESLSCREDEDIYTPVSSRSYLLTPDSPPCSTPAEWKAALPKEPLQLTFGIELEHVFAYDMILDRERNRAMSTMYIPQEILRRAGIKSTVENHSPVHWDLHIDGSIREPERKLHAEDIPGKVIKSDAIWRGVGHELVSRKLPAPTILTNFTAFKSSDAMREIEYVVNTVHGTSTDPWAVMVNDSCGLHVHVARCPQDGSNAVMLPLPVLQHLAYLLAQFEELISFLHPPNRRGADHNGRSCFWVGSNLMGVRRSSHYCLRHAQINLENAREKIFAKNMTAERLAKLMGTEIPGYIDASEMKEEVLLKDRAYNRSVTERTKFVNFARIESSECDDDERTVEFRQHRGTMDFLEIAHWVYFVLSLVKAAERLAMKDDLVVTDFSSDSQGRPTAQRKLSFLARQGLKYEDRPAALEDQYTQFFDLLGFDWEPRNYWLTKWCEYNPYNPNAPYQQDETGRERLFARYLDTVTSDTFQQSSNTSSQPDEPGSSPDVRGSPRAAASAHSSTNFSEVEFFIQSQRTFRPPPSSPYIDVNRPLGSPRTWLLTPSESLCSTPDGWKATLPQEPLQLTYGIELEHLFTFNSQPSPRWQWIFKKRPSKNSGRGWDASGTERPEIVVEDLDNSEAPGFTDNAIRDQSGEVLEQAPEGAPTEYDTYDTMTMQQTILRQQQLTCTVNNSSVAQWEIKGDGSIWGPDKTGDDNWLRKSLPGKRISKNKEADWLAPTRGHELVSRVLGAPSDLSSFDTFQRNRDLQEIGHFLRAMHGAPPDPWGVFVNETCGFHMHVARVPQDGSREVMLPLPVLQHLAYLLLQYEELITSLHAPERRALAIGDAPVPQHFASNLMGLRRSAHLCPFHVQIESDKAQRKIFAADMTSERLAKLKDADIFPCYSTVDLLDEIALRPERPVTHITTRYKFVNFTRLLNEYIGPEAKTIEFRQHRATLDFVEISHWIHFVLSLVKAAERKASSSEPASPPIHYTSTDAAHRARTHKTLKHQSKQGDKYNRRHGKLADQFVKFFNLLGFDEETRQYWTGKFREYNPEGTLLVAEDEVGAERIVTREDECPACRREREDFALEASWAAERGEAFP
ncbi:hypothetical protein H2200_009582 [Cladophialophora chaetospira]|uniref:Amidoligase enzyme n=1 Tax=Cladophialophora chaetospira TaxID=386627 RepID=A0AA38X2P5_9EURO|nr:hypothetical protein H2200_009582 [Cladophialophora chaetospira]